MRPVPLLLAAVLLTGSLGFILAESPVREEVPAQLWTFEAMLPSTGFIASDLAVPLDIPNLGSLTLNLQPIADEGYDGEFTYDEAVGDWIQLAEEEAFKVTISELHFVEISGEAFFSPVDRRIDGYVNFPGDILEFEFMAIEDGANWRVSITYAASGPLLTLPTNFEEFPEPSLELVTEDGRIRSTTMVTDTGNGPSSSPMVSCPTLLYTILALLLATTNDDVSANVNPCDPVVMAAWISEQDAEDQDTFAVKTTPIEIKLAIVREHNTEATSAISSSVSKANSKVFVQETGTTLARAYFNLPSGQNLGGYSCGQDKWLYFRNTYYHSNTNQIRDDIFDYNDGRFKVLFTFAPGCSDAAAKGVLCAATWSRMTDNDDECGHVAIFNNADDSANWHGGTYNTAYALAHEVLHAIDAIDHDDVSSVGKTKEYMCAGEVKEMNLMWGQKQYRCKHGHMWTAHSIRGKIDAAASVHATYYP